EHLAQFEQPAGADAVGAPFILLYLLEGQSDRLTQLLLAHAEQRATQPDSPADMYIHRPRRARHMLVTRCCPAPRPTSTFSHIAVLVVSLLIRAVDTAAAERSPT